MFAWWAMLFRDICRREKKIEFGAWFLGSGDVYEDVCVCMYVCCARYVKSGKG